MAGWRRRSFTTKAGNCPSFKPFTLLESERGRAALRAYFDRYLSLAIKQGMGFVLESPTWRANPDWAAKVGHDREVLAKLNRAAIDLMRDVRDAHETEYCRYAGYQRYL
jgi:hypothetical protein